MTNEYFHLYNSEVSDNDDYKNCLYSLRINTDTNEWQLVPYCIRHNTSKLNDTNDQCYDDPIHTFEQLKLKKIDNYDLYRWNAPIDTINNYQKYIVTNDLSLANHHYCNCSANWFGSRCQYSFNYSSENPELNKIIDGQFLIKYPLSEDYTITDDISMLTCYVGLQCHSTICLDWREICDGILNCENGEDEPDECLLLETNECEDNEYRCRYGMCIPKTFLRDFSHDCMDLSDEKPISNSLRQYYSSCYSSSKVECDFHLCKINEYSCGDGQCLLFENFARLCSIFEDCLSQCNNGRDLFFRRNLFHFDISIGINNSNNISFECQFLMLCISGELNVKFFGYDYTKCSCFNSNKEEKRCLKYFRDYCPTLFIGQTSINILYPFGKLIYINNPNSSVKWYLPTYLCHKSNRCPALSNISFPLFNNLSCLDLHKFPDWIDEPSKVLMRFSACGITYNPILTTDKRLFYCTKSMKIISKHKFLDNSPDCIDDEDERYISNTTTMGVANANIIDRFKCWSSRNRWVPRWLLDLKLCLLDDDVVLYDDMCIAASDIGCGFLRGLNSSPLLLPYQENCNDMLILFSPNNEVDETDETNCEEWPKYRSCDGYWDLKNGEDELNCSNTTTSYITRTILKCHENEHYCIHQNGTMGCISKKYAGDYIDHCLGGTDEKPTTCFYTDAQKPFRCSVNGECISLSSICDGEFQCSNGQDEMVCPWSHNRTEEQLYMFICKNGTGILRKKQCDGIIDCQPDAEDEWLCDLAYQKIKDYFHFIEEYPRLLRIDSPHQIIKSTSHQSIQLASDDFWWPLNDLRLDWYCNRGLIVTTRSSNIECLCPPSYYGKRCEYQSERILITLRIDTPANYSRHQSQQNVIRLLARLMIDNRVVHHEDIFHMRSMKQLFCLNYPRPPPKQRGNWSVRFDAFSVNKFSVTFIASWLFDVSFSFLPFNRLILHLTLEEHKVCTTFPCVHGNCRKYLNFPHYQYCLCDENWSGQYCNISTPFPYAAGGKCFDGYRTPICVCPLSRMGHDCHALFDPCNNIQCQNGGTCIPLDSRLFIKYICACRNRYYGIHCEFISAQVDISFSKSLLDYNHLLSTTVFAHFLSTNNHTPGILSVENRLLYKQVKLNERLHIFNENHEYISQFVLLQIFFKPNHFRYYIATIIKNRVKYIITTIHKTNQCPYVDEVLRNRTIRQFPSMKKIKYYYHVCKENNVLKCFYDEAYLCFCDKDRQPQCFIFQQISEQCTTNYCHNNGQCVKNSFDGVWDFACVCGGCAYGSLCQLTTSQYALSLDPMLGLDILANISLTNQPFLIKLILIIIILILSLGLLSNALSLITFKQPKPVGVVRINWSIFLFSVYTTVHCE
ncbi:unnamed protein product [Adineta steineri]|uniref:EGF-like domain-containing protein n=1 Tax=Adineta steineri TaxID=433720 RepID=A0A814TAI4_9BILA|nr:unnamed protein product [Adineta steineri]CAF1159167.1 unnamed protein product [Adineta steineri]